MKFNPFKHLWRFIWYRPFLLAWAATATLWLWCVLHAKHIALPGIFLVCMLLGGCAAERKTQAQMAANIYTAAEAAQAGADLKYTMTAVRLLAGEIAKRNGFTIQGYEQWKLSLPPSP